VKAWLRKIELTELLALPEGCETRLLPGDLIEANGLQLRFQAA
jgi:hypothetical protein